MQPAGYSGTPLFKKLGIKEGFKVRLINQPAYYRELLGELIEKVEIIDDTKSKKNFIHYFTKEAKQLERDIAVLHDEIVPNGIIWISWPKKVSKVATDITEDVIRNIALANGLVDVKVCAVDDIWSALKLVIRLKDRGK